MLKNDALQQLAQLKDIIRSQKELAQGTVRGSQGRFGFVELDDGGQVFLAPDIMQRVFPGDRVEVNLIRDSKKKLNAELEKLLSSPLRTIIGSYRVRGQGHFIACNDAKLNRWIYLPAKARKQCQDGDYVKARITRHPFSFEGKAQARIESRIGNSNDVGIEHDYIITQFDFPTVWSADEQAQALNIADTASMENDKRQDLTHLTFLTIDATDTRDMDDALYIETNPDGWKLYVAIADPTHLIESASPLDLAAKRRASTVYLPGSALTMLPETLSYNTFSLLPEQNRPALVCCMTISNDGAIQSFQFTTATVRSHCKLNYVAVAQYLAPEKNDAEKDLSISNEVGAQLKALSLCSEKRLQYRAESALVTQERADYELILNDQKKVERIEKVERTIAHHIVEEAMLATNYCAGKFLMQHNNEGENQNNSGIFSSHAGFREEKLKDAMALIEEQKLSIELGELTDINHYQSLIQHLQQQNNPNSSRLLSTLARLLQPSVLTTVAKPHFGLGFAHYATVTSPIRRYQDFHNHLVIKSLLNGQQPISIQEDELNALKEQLKKSRQACKQMGQWLICQYIADRKGSIVSGKIVLVNSQGIGIRLDDTGIEGYVLLNNQDKDSKEKRKLSFDQIRLTLKAGGEEFYLDQAVRVKVSGVDMERKQIKFELATNGVKQRN